MSDAGNHRATHLAFCDGGLSNRLNALIFALVLREKFGGNWEMSWPRNNWCGAAFGRLFSIDMPVHEHPLGYYKEQQACYRFLIHENQGNFSAERIVLHSKLIDYDDYGRILAGSEPVFYYHNLLPPCTDLADVKEALSRLRINSEVFERASRFCAEYRIDDSVLGLHIRKTDFGNKVDDQGLFQLVANNPNRFFVCSDDAEVNERFAGLTNCSVFKKQSFPAKMVADGGWNSVTVDSEGRAFGFNISRPEESVIEGLIDLLILSRTRHVLTSHSTFLQMSMLFKGTGFFRA